MKKFKYIIVEQYGLESAIVFDPLLQHDEVAAGKKILGAGVVTFDEEDIFVSGKSISTGVGNRGELDVQAIRESATRRSF